MNEYIIWWFPTKQNEFLNQCPFIEIQNSIFVPPSAAYPEGFFYVEQGLSVAHYNIVNAAANALICIDVKPSPHPPYSPTGR